MVAIGSARPSRNSVLRRAGLTFGLAAMGAAVGYTYARLTLSPAIADKLAGMFAGAGAATFVLGFRILAMARYFLRDR